MRGVTRPWDRSARAAVGTGQSRQPAPAPAPRALRLCAPRPMCDDRTVYRNALACYFCGRKPRTSHRAGTGTILMSQPSSVLEFSRAGVLFRGPFPFEA